jgi:hypothetical protein
MDLKRLMNLFPWHSRRSHNLGPPNPSLYFQAAFDQKESQERRSYEEYLHEKYSLRFGWNRPKLLVGDGRCTLTIAYVRENVAEQTLEILYKEIQDLTIRGKSRAIMDDPYCLLLVTCSISALLLWSGVTSGTIKLKFPWLESLVHQLFSP